MTPKTTRIPEELLKIIEFRAEKERLDESTAIRQLLHSGAKHYISQLYKDGELTLREAAELLGASTRETLEILWEEGVKGNVLLTTQQKALETTTRET